MELATYRYVFVCVFKGNHFLKYLIKSDCCSSKFFLGLVIQTQYVLSLSYCGCSAVLKNTVMTDVCNLNIFVGGNPLAFL